MPQTEKAMEELSRKLQALESAIEQLNQLQMQLKNNGSSDSSSPPPTNLSPPAGGVGQRTSATSAPGNALSAPGQAQRETPGVSGAAASPVVATAQFGPPR
jgi:hypothetical protein